MSSSPPAVVQPPWDMTAPPAVEHTALASIGAVVALMVIGALYWWKRTGNPAGVLTLLGGYVCSFNEAPLDVLSHCFFPLDGWNGYSAFGRAVPVWVVLAYVGFFGGLTFISVLLMQSGWSRGRMWAAIGGVWVINVILEVPILRAGLYLYYGPQPFVVGGFPLSWLVINSLGSLLAAVVITRLSWFFTGVRALLLLAVPYVTYMASWTLAMPHFAVTNADVGMGTRMVAAAISIVLGLIAIDVLIRIGTGQWRLLPPDRSPAPTAAPEREQTPAGAV